MNTLEYMLNLRNNEIIVTAMGKIHCLTQLYKRHNASAEREWIYLYTNAGFNKIFHDCYSIKKYFLNLQSWIQNIMKKITDLNVIDFIDFFYFV